MLKKQERQEIIKSRKDGINLSSLRYFTMGFIQQISTTNNLNFVEQNSRDWVSDLRCAQMGISELSVQTFDIQI